MLADARTYGLSPSAIVGKELAVLPTRHGVKTPAAQLPASSAATRNNHLDRRADTHVCNLAWAGY
jgi:hypothetical protein